MLQFREPLRAVGWSDRVEAAFHPFHARDLTPGRVLTVERSGVEVATPTGDQFVAGHGLAPGDWVGLSSAGRVEGVIDRWSALQRLDALGQEQVLAANVDLVLIAAPADRLSVARVEREVMISWDSGARPVVVVTKFDLAEPDTVEPLVDRLSGVDLIVTSATAGSGLAELESVLGHPTTAVLVGPSGAGKSTLINALLGEERLKVGAVRSADSRGRHTTTTRTLVPLPTGGTLIDSPGLRSLGTDASDEALARTFADIAALAETCRFNDCGHTVEPSCGVLAAVEDGRLDPARLASFRKLEREVAYERRRTNQRERKAEQRKWKVRQRASRQAARHREEPRW